jgi:hypothetical protein
VSLQVHPCHHRSSISRCFHRHCSAANQWPTRSPCGGSPSIKTYLLPFADLYAQTRHCAPIASQIEFSVNYLRLFPFLFCPHHPFACYLQFTFLRDPAVAAVVIAAILTHAFQTHRHLAEEGTTQVTFFEENIFETLYQPYSCQYRPHVPYFERDEGTTAETNCEQKLCFASILE